MHIYTVLLVFSVLIAGCDTYMESDLYFLDMEDAATEDLDVRITLNVPLPSLDDCVEYRERYERVWALSPDFDALSFVRCHDEGFNSYVAYEMDIPLVFRDLGDEPVRMSGPVEITLKTQEERDATLIYLTVSPRALHRLDALIYDEFWEHVDLGDSAPRFTFVNDTRQDQYLRIAHAFVQNEPVLNEETFVLERRDSIDSMLSNVASAWVFTPLAEGEPRMALLGIWETEDPEAAAATPTPVAAAAGVPSTSVAVSSDAGPPCLSLECDKQVLLTIRDTLRGSNTTALSSWQEAAAIQDFAGITIAGEPSRVVGLRLDEQELAGTLPPELGQLAQLRQLWLRDNQLTGSIPPELGQLVQLRGLSLRGNQLTGSIPLELGQLVQIHWLGLDVNQLTGPIPSALGQLVQLQGLALAANQLTGSIPPELGQLAQLQTLWLGSNQLTGPIPLELGQLAQLQQLGLYGNQLTGSIPPELGQLTQLQQLWLDDNQLTGSVPPELGQLAQLQELDLYDNQLTALPPELGQLAQLQLLLLHYNRLTALPPELGQLQWLSLSGNDFTGCLPNGLAAVCLDCQDLVLPICQ